MGFVLAMVRAESCQVFVGVVEPATYTVKVPFASGAPVALENWKRGIVAITPDIGAFREKKKPHHFRERAILI
jgi:hypothetical protein